VFRKSQVLIGRIDCVFQNHLLTENIPTIIDVLHKPDASTSTAVIDLLSFSPMVSKARKSGQSADPQKFR
jgi:hypothetical protein